MFPHAVERAFRRSQMQGDSRSLAFVFDATATELRSLARHLASPEAPAEDLLQATYLTAIESRNRFDASQRVLPWLVGILANHAREARRRNRRVIDPRRLHEELAQSPSDEAESAELSQTLDSAISRLPEAYRSVLRLYLQHGLEPAEIARSLERPQGTVRAQLSRGLKQLQRLLPGSLVAPQSYALVAAARWTEIRSAVLGSIGGGPVPLAGGVLTFGFLAMSLNKKLLTVAGILIAAFLTYTFRSEFAAESVPKTANEIARADVEAVVSAVPLAAEPLPTVLAREVLPRAPAPAAPSMDRETGSLRVHVTDNQDVPLAGVGLALFADSLMQSPGSAIDFVLTDASGNVSFDELRPTTFTVQIDRSMNISRSKVAAGETREITMRIGGVQVDGSVVDDAGLPVADAEIWAHGMQLNAAPIARSDERGMFSVAGPSQGLELQARKPGFAPSLAHPVLGKDGESWTVQLKLEGAATEVTGRVLDPGGAPVDGAFVAFAPELTGPMNFDRFEPRARAVQTRTAADGSFRVRDVPRGTMVVTAVGRVVEWTPAGQRIEIGATPAHVELKLQIGATLEGTLSENGKPRSRCTVSAFTKQSDLPRCSLSDFLALRACETERRGHFRIVGILPGEVDVGVRRTGFDFSKPQTISLRPGETRRLDLDFSAEPGAPFEFAIDPAKSPVMGGVWWVRVSGGDEARPMISLYPVEGSGRFAVARLAPGRYTAVVFCQPEQGDMVTMLTTEFDAADGRLELRIPADRLRLQPVRGRVLDAARVALKERTLKLHSLGEVEAVVLQRATTVDGAFSFAGVPPGSYVLSLLDGDSTKILREFTVVGDRSGELGDVMVD